MTKNQQIINNLLELLDLKEKEIQKLKQQKPVENNIVKAKEPDRVRSAEDIYPFIKEFADKKQEKFIVVSLNSSNDIIAVRCVTVGLLNRTLVCAREVFADPITDRAASVVLAHNHTGSNLDASMEDLTITSKLIDAGKLLGIKVLDHIVFNTSGFRSFINEVPSWLKK